MRLFFRAPFEGVARSAPYEGAEGVVNKKYGGGVNFDTPPI